MASDNRYDARHRIPGDGPPEIPQNHDIVALSPLRLSFLSLTRRISSNPLCIGAKEVKGVFVYIYIPLAA